MIANLKRYDCKRQTLRLQTSNVTIAIEAVVVWGCSPKPLQKDFVAIGEKMHGFCQSFSLQSAIKSQKRCNFAL